jgi:hypothetical protein
MIVSAASQAQRASDFIMGVEHKESLQECQTSPEGMQLTWAREHGIDTRIPGFAHIDQDSDGVSTPINGSTAPSRATGSPGHTDNPRRYEKPEHSPAHLRAPAPSSRTFKNDPRPGRPVERAVRSAFVPSQFGSFTVRRSASPASWQNFAPNALVAATARDLGRFESSALPPSQTPQRSAVFPNHRVCPPILSFLAVPQAALAPGEKKGRRHPVRPLNRSPSETSSGTVGRPSATDRPFLPSRSFSRIK